MSRLSILNELTSKLLEIENLFEHKNQSYASKNIRRLALELSDLRYTNAIVGEHSIQKWNLRILRKIAERYEKMAD